MTAEPRYKIVRGSQSYHCCFGSTIVDTTKPVMIGEYHYENQFEPVCECFEDKDAELICRALNLNNQTLEQQLNQPEGE